MKKRVFCLVCAAVLLVLGGCTPAGEVSPTPTPGESVTPGTEHTPAEADPEPSPGEIFPFAALPVTEEAIQSYFAAIGQPVNSITPCEGDYLVEACTELGGSSFRLYWIFGSTGRTVWLTGILWNAERYSLTGRGSLLLYTSGYDNHIFYHFPSILRLRVLGDENGSILGRDNTYGYSSTAYVGLEDLEGTARFLFSGEPAELARYHQLADARIGVNGLSFSFVPSGASVEQFQSCMAGAITTPTLQMQFDPDSRLLTIRFYNTCLSSENGITQEALQEAVGEWVASYYHYPYSFPAGSLGRDSAILQDVEVHADGEDMILTCTVAEHIKSFTIKSESVGTQCIVFSSEEPNYPLSHDND